MNCYLSKTEIVSFRTNVVCLKLLSDSDIRYADIKWECDSDILRIRDFSGTGEFDLNDGILLSLDKVGSATVSAIMNGEKYECRVTVREPKCFHPGDKLNFFVGDLHAHSSWNHELDGGFTRRKQDFPADMVKSVVKDGRLDFFTVSDHGSIMKPFDLFRTFFDIDSNDNGDVVFFPASESECVENIYDELGIERPETGEFVMINAQDYIFSKTHAETNAILESNPHALISIAHPTCYSTYWCKGKLLIPKLAGADKYPSWKRAVRMIEIGNGSDRGSTILFEPEYSRALDYGFKVSPVSTSDSHGRPIEIPWCFDSWPGKTVIVAPEKSKEMFLDAIKNNRVYATENGNTSLLYTVNGAIMGSTLSPTTIYNFHVEIGDIDSSNPQKTVRCEVISDYGNKIKTIENADFSSFDFTVESDTARYFFLRIVDSKGLKTWSAPVFTGREYDRDRYYDPMIALNTEGATVTDERGGDASIVLCGDPKRFWRSSNTCDVLTVDLKRSRSFSAIKLRAPEYDYMELRRENKEKNTGLREPDIRPLMAEYPAEYRVSASEDGVCYTVLGQKRSAAFGIGDTMYFDKTSARFIKIELLSTMGKYCDRPEYAEAKLGVGEIQIFE